MGKKTIARSAVPHGHGRDRGVKSQLHFKSARIYYLSDGRASPLNLPREENRAFKGIKTSAFPGVRGEAKKAAMTLLSQEPPALPSATSTPGAVGSAKESSGNHNRSKGQPPHHFCCFFVGFVVFVAFPTHPPHPLFTRRATTTASRGREFRARRIPNRVGLFWG